LPTNRVGPQTNRFATELKKSLANDGRIDKQEGRKLRQQAVSWLAKAPDSAKAATRFSDDFAKLVPKAADKASASYLNTVAKEFSDRARYQQASEALQKYAEKLGSKLPKPLQNIDFSNLQGFEVGTSMNRGLWLRVPMKDQSKQYETCQAAEKLFQQVPELKKFGEIYVIST
jgi:Holliday junction resolvase-like predicted endonuclease